MKVFLSHSSRDKGYVEDVVSLLRPGTYELDSTTFDKGILNVEAIEAALKRSSLFCLFVSEDALASGYVNFEIVTARELYAKGLIERIVLICLDDTSFAKASDSLRIHNAIRKAGDAASSARFIQGALVSAQSAQGQIGHPFLNREAELTELQDQLFDHSKPQIRALFFSGNHGVGRRSLAKKFYANQFPYVSPVFAEIGIDELDGFEEIHRKVLYALKPNLSIRDLKVYDNAFKLAEKKEKARQIAQLLNSLLHSREATFFVDMGGVLHDSGALQPEINDIVNELESRPHPPLTFIAPRMVPRKFRRSQDDLAYSAVKSFPFEMSTRLLKGLLKNESIIASQTDIEKLSELGDGHPYNYYRMIEQIKETSLDVFLYNASGFVEWKHRRSSEYVRKITVSDVQRDILSILNLVPQLDFETLQLASGDEPSQIASALEQCIYDHIIESDFDIYKISPSLRVAVERDSRFALKGERLAAALQTIAKSLAVRIEEGSAAISLIDSAILADVAESAGSSTLSAAFLLPSHHAWLCHRQYDKQNFHASIRSARVALESRARLSRNAKTATCRFLCLAASRVGDDAAFSEGIGILKADLSDDWAKSNYEFLLGFNERFKGNLPKAETHLREAIALSTDNFSAARELASICAARGNLNDAEDFAREAKRHAPDNPYILDVLISVLIKRYGRSVRYTQEIADLFDALEKAGIEGARSFFETRKAEFENLWGSNKEAMRLIDIAVKKTPRIVDVRRIRAEILLKSKNFDEALKEINIIRDIVNSHSTSERRSNYRTYIDVYGNYLQNIGDFREAKELYRDNPTFTKEERDQKIKEIEIGESYKRR